MKAKKKKKNAVDTAMHNWSPLSYNTTNQPFKCLSVIRHGEGTRGGDKGRGKSGERGSV